MGSPYSRARNLAQNIGNLGPLMGGYASAFSYLLRTQGKSAAEAVANYRGHEFRFRRCDMPAIKEVLLHGEYAFLESILGNTDLPLVYDIGAHIGLFAIWTLSINAQAEIHSVEASPYTFGILESNAEAARGKGFSWQAQHGAAWKNNDEISFSNDLESSMSHRIDETGCVKVRGIALGDLLAASGNRKIDLMKIDIEGAEEAFLCAGDSSLDQVKNLVIELHPRLCDTERVEIALEKNFADIRKIDNRINSKPLLFCRK